MSVFLDNFFRLNKKCRLYSIISFVCLLATFSVKAQDPQFTQFYATPLYLNPAFTGLTYEHRFSANYRNQWPGVKRAYTTYMATYDYNISNLNSGIGFFALQDRAGTSNLVTSQNGLNFAYRIKVGRFSEARAGLQISMVQKKLDNTRLLFNDQLITGSAVSQDALSIDKINYLDVGVGGLFNSTNYWAGFAVKHINQPNASMVGDILPLPLFVSIHGGYRYIISARGAGKTKLEEFVSASVHYRHEQKYDQLDIGAYYFKQLVNLGIWYRGLPFKKYKPGYPNRESISLLVGLEIPDKNFRIGYSYDLTVSSLRINNSQGAHEVSIVYEIARKHKRNKRVLVTCPKF
ncbi:MAG: type IX secretion system membrane protein PorP/SprF [Bacteroidota bacterium]|nr:type IX secretion system membrane protein PorP/SprF [Bacteroidota bacterium]